MQPEEFFAKLLDVGAIKIDARPGHGFKMRIHDTDPKAPLSPVYLNLRTPDNPKPGPLTSELVAEIGRTLWDAADEAGISFDGICGIPNAGDPLARAFATAALRQGDPVPLLMLEKRIHNGIPRFAIADSGVLDPVNFEESRQNIVLLIDDVLTYGGTKDGAIQAVTDGGYDVKNVLVFCDRQQGGARHLRTKGIEAIRAFTLPNIIDMLRAIGKMSPNDAAMVLEYLNQSAL